MATVWLVADPYVSYTVPGSDRDGWFLLHDDCHEEYLDRGAEPDAEWAVVDGAIDGSGDTPDAGTEDVLRSLSGAVCGLCGRAVEGGRTAAAAKHYVSEGISGGENWYHAPCIDAMRSAGEAGGGGPIAVPRDAIFFQAEPGAPFQNPDHDPVFDSAFAFMHQLYGLGIPSETDRTPPDGADCYWCKKPANGPAGRVSRVASRTPNTDNHFPTAVDPDIDGYDHRCLICKAKPGEHSWHPGVDAQVEDPEDDEDRDQAESTVAEREEPLTAAEVRSFLEAEGQLTADEVDAVVAEIEGEDRTASRTASPVRYVYPETRVNTAVAGEGAYATDPHDSSVRFDCAPGTRAWAIAAYKTFGGAVMHDWEIEGHPGAWTIGGEWEVGRDPDWSLNASWDAEGKRWVRGSSRRLNWAEDVPSSVEAEARSLADSRGRPAYAVVNAAGEWRVVAGGMPEDDDVAMREFWPASNPDRDWLERRISTSAAGYSPQGEGPEWREAEVLMSNGDRCEAWTDGDRVALNRDDVDALVEYLDEDGYYHYEMDWWGKGSGDLIVSEGGAEPETVELRGMMFGPLDRWFYVLDGALASLVTRIDL